MEKKIEQDIALWIMQEYASYKYPLGADSVACSALLELHSKASMLSKIIAKTAQDEINERIKRTFIN